MSSIKAYIAGCEGLSLNADEIAFFKQNMPWGFILFARNIENPMQVKQLCSQMRELTGRDDTPILVDQEGGRVQRLKPPIWQQYPHAGALGALYNKNKQQGIRATRIMSRLHAKDLLELGINVDVLAPGAHDVIGERAYGQNPDIVAVLGREAVYGLMEGGVLPVMKHMPGHGRAKSDSHLHLPHVEAKLDDLKAIDFAPFKASTDFPMAMTAHIVFEDIDPSSPATTSKKVMDEIIRGFIGFDGLVMSDDVSMKALSGDFFERSQSIFAAGVDIVLHCNGDMAEMQAVADASPELQGDAKRRADQALKLLKPNEQIAQADLWDEFSQLMGLVA